MAAHRDQHGHETVLIAKSFQHRCTTELILDKASDGSAGPGVGERIG